MNRPIRSIAFSERRSTFNLAVGFALALLLLSGAGFRALAAYYSRPSTSVPIPKGTLAKLPVRIGEWVGEDTPMDERIVRKTDADDLVNRLYQRTGGSQAISLFVAYGVRLRDLSPTVRKSATRARVGRWTGPSRSNSTKPTACRSSAGCCDSTKAPSPPRRSWS